ncbi:MAG: hypothetical protein H6666_17425 [Ardenticatenaceae bacterium]|nr:hypothetical protein [Anaerolineales bacterium]MCB8919697.1 hypothetical protein [Ardenticatenaceae bacterium]
MADEINELKEAEKQAAAAAAKGGEAEVPGREKPQPAHRRRRHEHNPSMFGPIFLIALGVYFLLSNLNMLPDLNWGALFSMWPLFLIFAGLNIIVRQVPRPGGILLSGVVSLAALGVAVYLLLSGGVSDVNWMKLAAVQKGQVSFPADDVQAAQVDIAFNAYGGAVRALADSNQLIDGTITYWNEYEFSHEVSGGQAEVALRADLGSWLNLVDFSDGDAGEPWQLGLSPNVPLDLTLDGSSGALDLDLHQLDLQKLTVDASSGALALRLPAGRYRAIIDGSSGSMELTLPADGLLVLDVDGGSGSVTLYLPAAMNARVVIEDSGSGGFRPGDRLALVSGAADGEGTWETPGFAADKDGVVITLDIGSGSVTVRDS